MLAIPVFTAWALLGPNLQQNPQIPPRFASPAPRAHHVSTTLYAQSVQAALAPAAAGLELLLLDLRNGETLADTFADSVAPVAAGSLLKPFVALAFARDRPGPMPAVICHGHPDRCWKAGGHGRMNLTSAVGQSCNAYFLALAGQLGPEAAIPYLPPAPLHASAATLIGLDAAWPLAPVDLLRAYAALLAAPATPAQQDVIAGMRLSARRGTAARIGAHPGGVLAKTGTAPCLGGACVASGDGLAVLAVPALHPSLILLVRKRGTTGAMAAAAASPILTRLEALHAE